MADSRINKAETKTWEVTEGLVREDRGTLDFSCCQGVNDTAPTFGNVDEG